MPERTGYAEGIPSWTDLGTPDTEAAKAFYGTIFGWEWTDVPAGPDSGTYTMFAKNGKMVAGMGALTQEQVDQGIPPLWSTYFSTDDIDATLEKVTAAGGGVIMPAMEVMDTGKLAFFSDPTGAAAGLWEAGTHRGAQLVNEHGTLVWNELITNDTDTAGGFYQAVFGHRIEVFETANGPYSTLWAEGNVEGHAAAGMMAPPPSMAGVPNYWGVYFAVDDVDQSAGEITANGGAVIAEPFDVPEVGRMAVVQDPQGATFMIMKPARPLA